MRTGSAFTTGNGNAQGVHYGLRSFTTDFVPYSRINFSVWTFSVFQKKEKVCLYNANDHFIVIKQEAGSVISDPSYSDQTP